MVLQSDLITSLAAVAAKFAGERTRHISLYFYLLTSLIVEEASGII